MLASAGIGLLITTATPSIVAAKGLPPAVVRILLAGFGSGAVSLPFNTKIVVDADGNFLGLETDWGMVGAAALMGAGGQAFVEVVAANTGAKVGKQYGKNGTVVEHPGTEIDWSKTSKHGAERRAERGVTQETAESWIKNGVALEQSGGSKHLFFTPEGAVVVTTDGKIVTAIPSSYYDEGYFELSEALFGK